MNASAPRSRRTPSRRHTLAIVLGVLVLALVILVLVWDWNWFKKPIEGLVRTATGRELHIDGDLDVRLGRLTTVTAEGLRFANAPWGTRPEMATVQRVEVDIRPWALLFQRQARIPAVRLDQPDVLLETGPDRVGNWVFDPQEKKEPGKSKMERPAFGTIGVQRGRLQYIDKARRTDLDIQVQSSSQPLAPAQAKIAPPVSLRGKGHWVGNPVTLAGGVASPLQLVDSRRPYRIDLRAAAGPTKARARGVLIDPLKFHDFDLQLALSGRDLDDLYPLFGVAVPSSPPYRFDGRLTREGNTWGYDDFSGVVGDSDLSGDAALTVGGARPLLKATLLSKRLDFDDLAGFVGAPPRTGEGETANPEQLAEAARRAARPRVLPDSPYNLSKLRSMDADVRLTAQKINAPGLPIEDMEAHLVLQDGLLQLQPLNFGVAGGDITSQIRMDARADPIRTRADIGIEHLNLGKMFPDSALTNQAIGTLGGKMVLSGTGNSIATIMGSADGDIAFGMGQGQISALLLEVAGIDIAEALKFLVTPTKQVPVRCAFADFGVKDGLMETRALAFDSQDTIIIGSGNINLKNEALDLELRPRPKDRSILSLRSPLVISGTFKNPSILPDMKRLGVRGAIAVTLGTIAPPAALLATLETGPGEDSNCGGRYAK